MTANHTTKASIEITQIHAVKHVTTRKWFTRHLLRQLSRPKLCDEDRKHLISKDDIARPNTAPTNSSVTNPFGFNTSLEPPLVRPRREPPPRPPRPDSNAMRDVHAWLENSVTKPAPVVRGLPCMKESLPTSETTPEFGYTIPIVDRPEIDSEPPAQTRHAHLFCDRRRGIQVKMPSLLRTRSNRFARLQPSRIDRRSASMPVLTLVPEASTNDFSDLPNPSQISVPLTPRTPRTPGSKSLASSIGRFHRPNRVELDSDCHTELVPPGPGACTSVEQHVNAVLPQSPFTEEFTRLAALPNMISREASMGELSQAPTYSSGPAPPSYQSYAESIRTTSSFGCIDGMNSEHRRYNRCIKEDKAHRMKRKLKKFAKKAGIKV